MLVFGEVEASLCARKPGCQHTLFDIRFIKIQKNNLQDMEIIAHENWTAKSEEQSSANCA
jgi:hypothetical protein